MPKHTKTRSRLKTLYRVKNWSEYDRALVKRGSITFWLLDDLAETWGHTGKKQRGSQFDYSEKAIEIMQTVKNVFHLPNRATEGFLRSVFEMLHVRLCVPDHTTLSRRGKGLQVHLPKKADGHLDIVMDSSGLKIFGEGEWKGLQVHLRINSQMQFAPGTSFGLAVGTYFPLAFTKDL